MAAAAAMANDGHQNGRGRQATYSDGSIEREMERRPNDINSGKEWNLPLCTEQTGASYMLQDFIMFFHVSCEGLPGQ